MLWQPGRKQIALPIFCGLLILYGAWRVRAMPARALQIQQDTPVHEPWEVPAQNPPLFPADKRALTKKQQDAIVKENFKKTKKDVEKLSELTESLKKEIQASNPNVMSVDVVNKASKIEKLAKKIKDESEM